MSHISLVRPIRFFCHHINIYQMLVHYVIQNGDNILLSYKIVHFNNGGRYQVITNGIGSPRVKNVLKQIVLRNESMVEFVFDGEDGS